MAANSLSASGLQLGGSGSANLMDDYEEGSWTPVLKAGTTDVTPTTKAGWYAKIGRYVWLHGMAGGGAYGATNFPTDTSGAAILGGLPFGIQMQFSGRESYGTMVIRNSGNYVSTGITHFTLNSTNTSGTFTEVRVLRAGDGDYGGWITSRPWSNFTTDTNAYAVFDLFYLTES